MNLDWAWLRRNADDIARLLAEHALLAIIPVVAALLAAIPLGYLVFRTRRAANPILAVFGVIYSIPSLALFVFLPLVLGTSILEPAQRGGGPGHLLGGPAGPQRGRRAQVGAGGGEAVRHSYGLSAGSPGLRGSSYRWPCR